MVDRNKGQVITDAQANSIGRRLFKAIDQFERKTLNREEAAEFMSFLMDNLFHGSYREDRDMPKI